MNIKHFLQTAEDYEINRVEDILIIYLENDTHDINIEYDTTTETIDSYEAYNSLDDSSVILSEGDQNKLISWIKENYTK